MTPGGAAGLFPPFCLTILLAGSAATGCSSDSDPTPPPLPSDPLAIVLTSNLQVGGYALIDADHRVFAGPDLTHGDATGRLQQGRLYVLNRLGADNVQVIDPAADYATVSQFSVGAGSNPQDIAVVAPDRAYVALYNSSALRIVDPRDGRFLGEVELSVLAEGDPDGTPELASVLQVGGMLLVTAQHLERTAEGFIPAGASRLGRIDLATDSLVDVIALACPNPFNRLDLLPDGRTLLLAGPGRFDDLSDGCLEEIDAVAFESRGVRATERGLGGELAGVASDGAKTFVLLSVPQDSGARTEVLELTTGGTRGPVLYAPDGWDIWDLWLQDGVLWITDRSLQAPGLHLFPGGDPALRQWIPFADGLLPPSTLARD